jgi:hypothetical protein
MDADGKIVAVDIEGDFDILGPMAEPGGIIKPLHLAAGQDDLPHGLLVAGASLQRVPDYAEDEEEEEEEEEDEDAEAADSGPTWTAGRDFAIENGRNAAG